MRKRLPFSRLPQSVVFLLSLALLLTSYPASATPTVPPAPTWPPGTPVATVPPGTLIPLPTPIAGLNRAALVVRYADGNAETRCVSFAEEEISGEELLVRSGLQPVIDSNGSVCAIRGHGCPADDCFCECPFPDCEYWAYYEWRGGAWAYGETGAESSIVRNGDMQGWSWGPGNFTEGVPPPVFLFDQICGVPAQTQTPRPTATPTPTVSQPWPVPTRTPTATATPAPPAEIPEPSAFALLASGVAALAAWAARRQRG